MIEGETPDDLTPEKIELRVFRKSPLGTRIGDNIINPLTTRELLWQKKTQARKIHLEKEELRTVINKSYTMEKTNSPLYMIRMPHIKISNKKNNQKRIDVQYSDESDSGDQIPIDSQVTLFPEIAEVFWNKLESSGWKPETRQQATLTTVQNKMYLIGGVSRSINSDINAFFPSYKRWDKILTTGSESEPRFGHSTVEYKQRFYIFGGGTDFNAVHKLRECLSGVKMINLENKEMINLKCAGSYITTRKQHCSALVGKHMFIHGGLNQKNHLLDDAAILNLEKNMWKLLSIKGAGPGFCGFHTAVTVLAFEQRLTQSIYKLPSKKKNCSNISGIYIFGGISINRQAHNNLYVLRIGTKPLSWSIPETQGQPPSPRFQHSMTYNEKLNVIVVFGGRIDMSNTSHYTCFNDVHILNMNNLLWCTIKVLGNIPNPRSGHSAASYGSKIYIFGGVSNSSYCSSSLYYLELNPKVSRHLIEDEERRKARELEIEVFKAKKVEFSEEDRRKKLTLAVAIDNQL